MDNSDLCQFENLNSDNHARVIIHLDIDCFYAQVEELRNPDLKNKPVGVKQKNLIVTSNYLARSMGVKKCMWIQDALTLCPSLNIVCGEDLHDYRQYSNNITSLLKKYGCKVEKLGLDENFIDVTHLVSSSVNEDPPTIEGNIYNGSYEKCLCGCFEKLCRGSHIAAEMRAKIKECIGLTTCGGIAHNKLLAKLVGSTHKPNQQTVLFPSNIKYLLLELNSVRKLPGIGSKTAEILRGMGITTVEDVWNATDFILKSRLSDSTSRWLRDLCGGVDVAEVKDSGMPHSLGIEDASRNITSVQVIEEKFLVLLKRMSILLKEDGRIPSVLKVTIRKKEVGVRESRQCPIGAKVISDTVIATKDSPLLPIILSMVKKMLDTQKSFQLTLVGLAFTKFIQPSNSNTLLSFIEKKNSKRKCQSSLESFDRIKETDIDSSISDGNNIKICRNDECGLLADTKHNHYKIQSIPQSSFGSEETIGSSSTEKNTIETSSSGNSQLSYIECPPHIDQQTFKELPYLIQKELADSWKKSDTSHNKKQKCSQSRITNFFH